MPFEHYSRESGGSVAGVFLAELLTNGMRSQYWRKMCVYDRVYVRRKPNKMLRKTFLLHLIDAAPKTTDPWDAKVWMDMWHLVYRRKPNRKGRT
jgi:hypothetical protein